MDKVAKKVEKQVKKIKKNDKDVEKGIIALANKVNMRIISLCSWRYCRRMRNKVLAGELTSEQQGECTEGLQYRQLLRGENYFT